MNERGELASVTSDRLGEDGTVVDADALVDTDELRKLDAREGAQVGVNDTASECREIA